jgi:uncharacterized protein
MTRAAIDNVALVKDVYGAFGRGDVATVLGAMDERIEWYEAEGNPWHPGHAFVGPQQVLENVFAPIAQDFEAFEAFESASG